MAAGPRRPAGAFCRRHCRAVCGRGRTLMKTYAWLQTKSIFIAAGHSDADPGAVGNGFTEADIVLEFRDLVAIELRRLGMHFVKDGSPGENLPLRDAIRLAA